MSREACLCRSRSCSPAGALPRGPWGHGESRPGSAPGAGLDSVVLCPGANSRHVQRDEALPGTVTPVHVLVGFRKSHVGMW